MSWLSNFFDKASKIGDVANKIGDQFVGYEEPAPAQITYNYRSNFSNADDIKSTYGLNVTVNGQTFDFIPDSILSKGAVFEDRGGVQRQYYFPDLLKAETQKQIQDNGIRFDLSSNPDTKGILTSMGATTSGILLPPNTVNLGTPRMYDITSVRGPIQGMGTTSEGPSYIMPANGAYGRYIAQDGKITTLTQTGGSSLLGDIFGGWVDNLTGALGIQDLATSVNDFFQTDVGKALKLASLASNISNIVSEAPAQVAPELTGYDAAMADLAANAHAFAPEAAAIVAPAVVPELTGVDAALADLAASAPAIAPEIIATPVAAELTGVDAALADLANATPAFTGTELAAPITAETITQQIAPEVNLGTATAGDIAMAVDPVAANIATGMSAEAAAALAAEQAAADLASQEAARIAAENAAMDAALQDLANSASPVFASSAAAAGLTFKQGLDAVRAGLLINAITGDPLGLNDVVGSGGNTFANQGFAQVPVPEDWKSPTYTYSPVQNVTFEDLFPAVSLQGTQWQNMPQAQTFNEMFASGRQTPMGSPVDINQIVGSILGQSATS
jgi:hypothetical protein